MIDASGLAIAQALPVFPAPGEYFNIAKIITILVLIVPWLYFCPWVSKDTERVRAPQQLWSGIVVGSGALGVLIWLLVPYFALGLAIYALFTITAFSVYVIYRNSRVLPEHKIFTSEHLHSLFKKEQVKEVKAVNRVKIYDYQNKIRPQPQGEEATPEAITAYNITQEFLYDVLWRRASQVDICPAGPECRVRFVIDGMIIDRPSMELADSEAMIQFLKPVAGMNAEDRRKPQKGKISVDLANGAAAISLATTGTTGGQRMQFRLAHEIVQTKLGDLGMSDDVLAAVRGMARKKGLIIVSGRPGSGLTSTLYSLLREQDAFTQQIVTFEKSPAIELENITQHTYQNDQELADGIASAIRRDPDVLMVDNCPTPEAAAQIMHAAQSKIVLLGMHASDTFTALAKWVKISGHPTDSIQNLKSVLCQMLLRKLCTSCREQYKPDPAMLAKANLSPKNIDTFYRVPSTPPVDEKGNPIICSICQGIGYFGRTAAFELLEVTDELRQLVLQGHSLASIKAACRKNKMLYLQEQALRKVISGVTAIQEVIRVSQQPQTQAQPQAKK